MKRIICRYCGLSIGHVPEHVFPNRIPNGKNVFPGRLEILVDLDETSFICFYTGVFHL